MWSGGRRWQCKEGYSEDGVAVHPWGGLARSGWDSCHRGHQRSPGGFLSPTDHFVGLPDLGFWDLGWPVPEGWQGQRQVRRVWALSTTEPAGDEVRRSRTEPTLAMGGREKAARLSSLSSRSHLSFPGDSQAGQVSESSHQQVAQGWQRAGPGSTEAAGQRPVREGGEKDGVYVGLYLQRSRGGRVDPKTQFYPKGSNNNSSCFSSSCCASTLIREALGPHSERKQERVLLVLAVTQAFITAVRSRTGSRLIPDSALSEPDLLKVSGLLCEWLVGK